MRLSTALRIASIIIVAKAVLIGVVYWHRAETFARALHIGADSWTGLTTMIAIGLAIAAGVNVAARHSSRDPERAAHLPATRSPGCGPSHTSRVLDTCRPCDQSGNPPRAASFH